MKNKKISNYTFYISYFLYLVSYSILKTELIKLIKIFFVCVFLKIKNERSKQHF